MTTQRKMIHNDAFGLLVVLLCCLLRTTQCEADDFCLLDDNSAALQVRVDLIESATTEISLAYYAIDSGDVPYGLLQLLRQAACRGVRVRILADGLRTRLSPELSTLLRRDGVDLRLYHPLGEGKLAWINRRLHSKLMVVDRRHMVIGSRNLQDHHFGLETVNYVDCDAYLDGDVSRQAAEYFDALWQSADVLPAAPTDSHRISLSRHRRMRSSSRFEPTTNELAVEQHLESSLQRLVGHRPIRIHNGYQRSNKQTSSVTCLHSVQACLIHDQGTDKSERQMQQQIVALINSAQSRLFIETPYPVFTASITQALQRASGRGVCTMLLTNSLESTDNVLTYAAYQNRKKQLLDLGIQLFEYAGRDHLHVKSMVVDDRRVMLGSYNFDERSDSLNLELCVTIDDSRVASLVMQSTSVRLQRAENVRKDRLLSDVGGDPSPFKRTRMRLSQFVAPLIRRSL